MYVSLIGYYVFSFNKSAVYDGGLWMMYESDDVEKCKEDFLKVAEDLKPQYEKMVRENYHEEHQREIEFELDVVAELDKLPKMWKNRKVQKL